MSYPFPHGILKQILCVIQKNIRIGYVEGDRIAYFQKYGDLPGRHQCALGRGAASGCTQQLSQRTQDPRQLFAGLLLHRFRARTPELSHEDGEEYGKLILGEGCLFNETPALAGTSWYTVFFCCLDAAEIWRFDASLLEDEAFLASHPHLAINLMRSIARKASIFFFHLARTHSTTSMCRLCDLLLQLSNPHQPDLCMSQSDVAAMMGLHQTTVARLIRRLREEGIIGRFTKRELQVLDRERLRRLAQHGDLKA